MIRFLRAKTARKIATKIKQSRLRRAESELKRSTKEVTRQILKDLRNKIFQAFLVEECQTTISLSDFDNNVANLIYEDVHERLTRNGYTVTFSMGSDTENKRMISVFW